jgi:N-acyl-D-glutamate deacylase
MHRSIILKPATYPAVLAVFFSVLLGGCEQRQGSAVASDELFDIVISNGRVIDPETELDGIRNVGIRGEKIVSVTTDNIQGSTIIDAAGKVVAPGFIDLHAHGQDILAARVQALDGVTTALELEGGILPIADFYDAVGEEGRPIHYGASVNWASARIAEKTGDEPTPDMHYVADHMDELSWQQELASTEQLAGITARVQRGLDEGGLGIGFLLGYAPGSGRKEYHALHELAAENSVPTFTHARYLSAVEPNSSFEGFQEMVAVAASTGAHMHVCHLNSMSLRDSSATSSLIRNAQKNGVHLSVEAYPYGAGETVIGAAMFKGPNWQERLGGIKKSDFTVSGEALTDEKFDRLQSEAPGTVIIVRTIDPVSRPEDQTVLDQSVLFPGGAIASDGGNWATPDAELIPQTTWPLPESAKSHPRSAGTFSRFLRIYVREREVISLPDAIAKLTLYPAQVLEASVPQMRNKGRIQEGADADIVVFDLNQVSDRATFERPAQTSVGFEQVIVAGTLLVLDGVLDTDVLPGQAIRREVR